MSDTEQASASSPLSQSSAAPHSSAIENADNDDANHATAKNSAIADRSDPTLNHDATSLTQNHTTHTSQPGPFKLFVGQVPPETPDSTVHALFAPYGNVVECVLLMDKISGRSRGCGFVTYSSKSDADSAIAALNDRYQFVGAKRTLIVRYAGTDVPPKSSGNSQSTEPKLYVGMLDRNSTEQSIRNLFEPFGQVTEVYILRDRITSLPKGQAFVRYFKMEEAQAAIAALDNKHRDNNAPGMLQVRMADAHAPKNSNSGMTMFPYAHSLNQPSAQMQYGNLANPNLLQMYNQMPMMNPMYNPMLTAQSMHQQQLQSNPMMAQMNPYMPAAQGVGSDIRGPEGANIFVYNIPDNYTDADLFQLFSNFGTVLSTRVQRDVQTGLSKGFGFVSFTEAANANAAITAMDGFMIGSKRLTVKLKANAGSSSGQSRFKPY